MTRVSIGARLRDMAREVKWTWFRGGIRTYAQEGEDLILERLFPGRSTGFFVDIGAHHPIRFSNTYLFYKLGWHGINVEPNPIGARRLRRYRKRDITIEAAVSKTSGRMLYYMFSEPAFNTLDPEVAKQRIAQRHVQLLRTVDVEVITLATLLDRYMNPRTTEIDFISIDVEGHDFEVLEGNDWTKYRPRVLLVETRSSSITQVLESPTSKLLSRVGYSLFAKTYNTSLYLRDR